MPFFTRENRDCIYSQQAYDRLPRQMFQRHNPFANRQQLRADNAQGWFNPYCRSVQEPMMSGALNNGVNIGRVWWNPRRWSC